MSFHCAFQDMYVLYCYGVYQDYYNSIIIPYIKFHEGLLTLEKVKNLNDSQFHVIVLDDLMEYVIKTVETQNLSTKYCYHNYNITAIFLTQNTFVQGHCATAININILVLIY